MPQATAPTALVNKASPLGKALLPCLSFLVLDETSPPTLPLLSRLQKPSLPLICTISPSFLYNRFLPALSTSKLAISGIFRVRSSILSRDLTSDIHVQSLQWPTYAIAFQTPLQPTSHLYLLDNTFLFIYHPQSLGGVYCHILHDINLRRYLDRSQKMTSPRPLSELSPMAQRRNSPSWKQSPTKVRLEIGNIEECQSC